MSCWEVREIDLGAPFQDLRIDRPDLSSDFRSLRVWKFLRFTFLRTALRDLRPPGAISFLYYVFTSRVLHNTPSGGSIFRCTTKDRGERRAKGLRSRPLDSGFLYGGRMPDVRTWYVFALVQFTRFRLVRWRAGGVRFARLCRKAKHRLFATRFAVASTASAGLLRTAPTAAKKLALME